jgi:hypothetical protein
MNRYRRMIALFVLIYISQYILYFSNFWRYENRIKLRMQQINDWLFYLVRFMCYEEKDKKKIEHTFYSFFDMSAERN